MIKNSLFLKNELMFSNGSQVLDVGSNFCVGVAIGAFIGAIIH